MNVTAAPNEKGIEDGPARQWYACEDILLRWEHQIHWIARTISVEMIALHLCHSRSPCMRRKRVALEILMIRFIDQILQLDWLAGLMSIQLGFIHLKVMDERQ